MRVGEKQPAFARGAQKDKKFLDSLQPSVKMGKRVIKAQPDMMRVQSGQTKKMNLPLAMQAITRDKQSKKND